MRPALNGPPGILVDNAADVSVEGLTIERAGLSTGHGISCVGTMANTRVRLLRVDLFSNDGSGLKSQACQVLLEGTKVRDNGLRGLEALASSLEVRQSQFSGNKQGGLLLDGCSFVIENNVIARNGSTTSSVGGIRLDGLPPVGPTYRLTFNTLFDNKALAGEAAGVRCDEVGYTVSDSIVWMHAVALSGACAVRFSDVGPAAAAPAGEGNLAVDPLFVNAGADDYHLMPASPVIDQADPAAPVAGTDLDGQPRVQGGRADMGADEAQ